MCQNNPGYVAKGDVQLKEPLQCTATGIEQKLLIADLDKGARPEAVEDRWRRPGAEKGDAK